MYQPVGQNIVKSFIITTRPLTDELGAMLIEHQGYRGFTLDTKLFNDTLASTATDVMNTVLRALNPTIRYDTTTNSTAAALQASADSLTFLVNSYGVGKHLPDSVALDMVNKLERSVIGHISNLLPDIDNDDVVVIGFERAQTYDYLITLSYPAYYESPIIK